MPSLCMMPCLSALPLLRGPAHFRVMKRIGTYVCGGRAGGGLHLALGRLAFGNPLYPGAKFTGDILNLALDGMYVRFSGRNP